MIVFARRSVSLLITAAVMTSLALLVAVGGCAAQRPLRSQQIYQAPPLEHGQQHPHLFFRSSDLPGMRAAVAEHHQLQAWWQSYIETASPDREIVLPPPDGRIQPDWARVTGAMGDHGARCALVYQMTGEKRYADWVRRWLLTYAQRFDEVNFQSMVDYLLAPEPGSGQLEGGNNMGFYFVGHLLTKAAFAYDCVYSELSPAEREEIREGFFYRFVQVIEGYDHSRRQAGMAPDYMFAGGQWNGANLCNQGLAAVGFLFNDARLYERAVDNWRLHLARDMLEDGFWIEEDLNYSNTCMATLFSIAWMARSSGYHQDLFLTHIQEGDRTQYDPRYYETLPGSDGPRQPLRRLDMFLDANLDYQLPNFGPGNWGWGPGRGSLATSGSLIAMYRMGHAIYGNEAYAFALSKVANRLVGLTPGAADLLLNWRPIDKQTPPPAPSRWFPHGRWIVLRNVESPQYWDSDAMYAFMPYGSGRIKGLQPLSLDIFAYGRSLAPRITLRGLAQNLTKAYQLTEPGWNNVMVNGCNYSVFRERIDNTGVNYVDLSGPAKVFSARLHMVGQRRNHLHAASVEDHPEEDRTMSRTLLMTDRYLVDLYSINYDRPSAYKHNFDYVLHGYGQLSLHPWPEIASRTSVTATWLQEGGVGLRSTVLSADDRGSMKISKFIDSHSQFMVVSRADFEERFITVHEPFKGDSQAIARIEKLYESAQGVALRIELTDGRHDLIWLRLADGAGLPSQLVQQRNQSGQVAAVDGALFPPKAAAALDYVFIRRTGSTEQILQLK